MENLKTIQNDKDKDTEKEKEKNKYLKLENSSQAFRNIIQNYKNNTYVPSQVVTIESCLQDFRSEKIKRLTDTEVLLEELGDEMKNFENEKIFRRKSNYKPIKPKKKESKVDFLTTLNIAKLQTIRELPPIPIPEGRKRKKGKTIFPIKTFSLNITYKNKLFRGRQSRKTHLYSATYKNQDTPQTKIDTIADDIDNESKLLYKTNAKKFNYFQEKFEDWKRTQEFTFFELKKNAIKNAIR